MTDQTPLEQKRAQARQYRGVTYDARIDRFTAAITIAGQRQHLGSFLTADMASIAYDRAREAHPISRERVKGGPSIRQLMAAFDEGAERTQDKHKNVVPGQIFTAPGGQRFRVEGFQYHAGRGWYLWTSRCCCCGELFEQRTTLNLRNIVSLLRTCAAHRGEKVKAPDAPDVWPDPDSWSTVPTGQSLERADEATWRAHEKRKDEIFAGVKGSEEAKAEFYRIEREIELPFSWAYGDEHPGGGDYDWVLAWRKRPVDPYAELLAKVQQSQQPQPSGRADAKRAMLEELAAVPPTDNSDLL